MAQAAPLTSDRLPLSPATSAMSNGAATRLTQPKTEQHNHIWLVTGPAGCGKSTVAQFIAKSMNLPFIEGDEVITPT